MTAAFNLSQLANNLNSSGQLDATDGLSGLVANANLASSGTASSSTFLRGDRTWQALAQKVVQVKYTNYLNNTTVSAGATFEVLQIVITPQSASNVIWIGYQLSGTCDGSHDLSNYWFSRNGTRVAVGNASSSAVRATGKMIYGGAGSSIIYTQGGMVYDEPASTASLTYSLYVKDENSDNTIYVNRASGGNTASNYTVTPSYMVILEVTP